MFQLPLPAFAIFLMLTLFSNGAKAKDRVAASFSLTRTQLSELRFLPASYRQAKIGITFIDPRTGGAIEKILFDAKFKPKRRMPDGSGGEMEVSDFFTKTTIKSAKSGRKISETALCDWNDDKTIATCVIEDDGGRYEIEAASLNINAPGLNFLIRRHGDYPGFRIAQEGKPSDEPEGIEIKTVRADSIVKSPIKF